VLSTDILYLYKYVVTLRDGKHQTSDNSPEDIIASRLLNQIRLVPGMPRKYSTAKKQLSFLSMKNLIVSRKSEIRTGGEKKSKNIEIESVNSPKGQTYKVRKCRNLS